MIERIREAPIQQVLEAYGFRHERNRWACKFHDDKRPSCTVWKNRLLCWVCNRKWSNIDLTVELENVTVGEAVKRLSALYGISDAPLSLEDRRRYAQAKAQAPDLARRLADFARGLEIIAERQLRIADALRLDPEHVQHWHQQAHALRVATAHDLAALWKVCPEQQAAVEALGRRDRIDAHEVTERIVELLAVRQEQERVAA